MNPSQQVRSIYRELRRVAGTELTARDLLRLAAAIVAAYHAAEEDDGEGGQTRYAEPFFASRWTPRCLMAAGRFSHSSAR
jgi:hypothetical protein